MRPCRSRYCWAQSERISRRLKAAVSTNGSEIVYSLFTESHPTGGGMMATLALGTRASSEERFFAGLALAMAAVIVAGFSTQIIAGRSSFGAPAVVHAHAIVFMGWVAIFVAQSTFVARGSMTLHRTLGWIAAGWTAVMVVMAFVISIRSVRTGAVPFFFTPQHFLILNPMTALSFAGLTWAAIYARKRTDWHRRLHVCGMAAIMGPGFGRLIPMPLLVPWSFQIACALGLAFPLAGMAYDLRRRGAVHPAWLAGVAVLVGVMLVGEGLAQSRAASDYYRIVTAGSAGADVAPLAYPPPP